ncbi:MAG: hypothetical protein VX100_07415 [Pseudomonadota bacterium]|nr:hypothetical protein [Pseudomonadota bacterium]
MPGKSKNTKFNWFHIFTAGKQTDSKGNENEFTQDDLNSVVTNFKPQTAPLVIGHPKMDDPAWGWVSGLKVDGDKLFAKASDVAIEFAEAVQNKRYPNRSVRLTKTDNGYALGHVGFLGGKPPAVEGLAWQFNADDDNALDLEFNATESMQDVTIASSNLLQAIFKGLRGYITEKDGVEKANEVLPEWRDEWLNETTVIANHERRKENKSDFNEHDDPNDEDTNVDEEEKKALEEKLKKEQDKNAKLEYQARVAAAQTFIDKEVNKGDSPRLTNVEGVAEFMASLESVDDDQTFEFAAADSDEPKKSGKADWFKSFLTNLPEQKGLTRDFTKDDDTQQTGELSATQLAVKALEYQQSKADAGVTISVADAMTQVTAQPN